MALGLRIYFLFAHLREHPQTYANSLSMHKQIETDFLHILFVLSMNFIPTLPRRERTHVTTPRRDTRSSPYKQVLLFTSDAVRDAERGKKEDMC